jgi:bacterioferritin
MEDRVLEQLAEQNHFLQDVTALRDSARACLREPNGARQTSIALLQTVLAAEIVCVLRYTMISVSHDGLKNGRIGAEFQAQANDERKHMKMAAARIVQLGGEPDYNPPGLASRVAALNAAGGFAARVAENLAAERSVIEHYRELIRYFEDRDPETCAMLEDIIRDEEDHTGDMQDILEAYAG